MSKSKCQNYQPLMTGCWATRIACASRLRNPPRGSLSTHLEPEPSPIRQTWLFRVHLSTDGFQVSVKSAIIEGAEFHLHCLRTPDDPPWQAEERCQPMPGGLSIGGRKIGVTCPHHQIGERQLEHGHHLIFGML